MQHGERPSAIVTGSTLCLRLSRRRDQAEASIDRLKPPGARVDPLLFSPAGLAPQVPRRPGWVPLLPTSTLASISQEDPRGRRRSSAAERYTQSE